jgi:hypothetical protein
MEYVNRCKALDKEMPKLQALITDLSLSALTDAGARRTRDSVSKTLLEKKLEFIDKDCYNTLERIQLEETKDIL